ncbi:MAG: hypothetical protein DI628_06075 [Blastochloris viridis]|uniref:Uncharacterized protein n=1 Tax=Blastochloris viridis TaxID=1079 RepID=A0A6N4R8A9_BLAVI|nr:MAG: hypothetical protein DI628_06075 [Blastochloris viridis]
MQNTEQSTGIQLSNHAVVLEVSIKATGYCNNIRFETEEEATKAYKRLDRKQLLLSNGAVVNIHEKVKYTVKPATLN